MAQAEAFQDFIADLHLFDRIGRKAHADRIANARPQKIAKADGRFDRARHKAARLGNPKVDRRVRRLGKLLIGGGGEEHVRGFAADLELVKIVVLQDFDMIEPAFHHRIGARLAVLFQKMFLKRAGVDTNADRTAVILGRLDDFLHTLCIADVARVDPQAGSARLGRFNRAFVVEMDIGDDRHRAFAHDFFKSHGRGLVRRRDANNVGPRLCRPQNLLQRRLHIMGEGVGHGLHGDWRVTPDRHVPDHDLAGFAALDIAPRADGIMAHREILNGLTLARYL